MYYFHRLFSLSQRRSFVTVIFRPLMDWNNNLIYCKKKVLSLPKLNVIHVTMLHYFPARDTSQDKISPFNRLNGDWMVAEWRLNGDGKGGFQSHFSHHSVDWIAGTFQWPFSQLIFWKIKLRPTRLDSGSTNQRESTLIIRPLGPLDTIMNI